MIMNVYTTFFDNQDTDYLNSSISQSRLKQVTVYYKTPKLFDCFMILAIETRKKTQETVRNIEALGKVITYFFTYSLKFFVMTQKHISLVIYQ